MEMEQTECSETSAYKLQTPGNYPKESIKQTEHGESQKELGILLHLPAYEDGTDRVFRNVGI